MSIFDGSQKEIGRGAQAVVYSYRGYAYKVYKDSYPLEYIRGEYLIQNEINQTDLPVVRYYKTDEAHVIRMDLIDGITLADRMKNDYCEQGISDMIQLQKKILTYTNENLPTFCSGAMEQLERMSLSADRKELVLHILKSIPERRNLLHLDLHFLNIMYAENQYYIINWVNARTGNPIYDYARSYVILQEISEELSNLYLKLLTEDSSIDLSYFHKAVYVMAVLRTCEHQSDRTDKLIVQMEKKITG